MPPISRGERPILTVTPDPGATANLSAPSGSIAFPWLPEGATAKLNGVPIALDIPGKSSEALLPGSYQLALSLPGYGDCEESINIIEGHAASSTSTVPFAITVLGSRLTTQKTALAQKNQSLAFGWTALVAGGLGAAAGVASYFLGSAAYAAYNAATATDLAEASRAKAKLFSNIVIGGSIVGGTGLLIAPMVLFKGPNPVILKKSIDDLNSQIEALKASGK